MLMLGCCFVCFWTFGSCGCDSWTLFRLVVNSIWKLLSCCPGPWLSSAWAVLARSRCRSNRPCRRDLDCWWSQPTCQRVPPRKSSCFLFSDLRAYLLDGIYLRNRNGSSSCLSCLRRPNCPSWWGRSSWCCPHVSWSIPIGQNQWHFLPPGPATCWNSPYVHCYDPSIAVLVDGRSYQLSKATALLNLQALHQQPGFDSDSWLIALPLSCSGFSGSSMNYWTLG